MPGSAQMGFQLVVARFLLPSAGGRRRRVRRRGPRQGRGWWSAARSVRRCRCRRGRGCRTRRPGPGAPGPVELGAGLTGGRPGSQLGAGHRGCRVDQHGEVGAVGQHLHHRQRQLGRGPPQQRRPGARGQPPALETVEVTGPLSAAHRGAAADTARLPGSSPRPTTPRPRRPQTRGCRTPPTPPPAPSERRPIFPRPRIAELGGVALSVGHIDLEPVDRHQPPPPNAPARPQRPHRGGRPPATGPHLLEHLSQHPCGPAVYGPG